ncbi:cell division protein FtsZ, partial [Nanoarchaeota archaeon]
MASIIEEAIEETPVEGVKAPRIESKTKDVDRELLELLEKKRTAIKVVGVGGGGGNTITRMSEVGIVG